MKVMDTRKRKKTRTSPYPSPTGGPIHTVARIGIGGVTDNKETTRVLGTILHEEETSTGTAASDIVESPPVMLFGSNA